MEQRQRPRMAGAIQVDASNTVPTQTETRQTTGGKHRRRWYDVQTDNVAVIRVIISQHNINDGRAQDGVLSRTYAGNISHIFYYRFYAKRQAHASNVLNISLTFKLYQ